MRATDNSVFGTGFMLAIVLAAFAFCLPQALAEDEEPMPAVDVPSNEEPVEGSEPTADEASSPALVAPTVSRETSGSRVMDSIELSRTEITGNQELPKVLYIVPWQKSDPGDLMGRPVNSLLDEVLAPIDREEFVRQIDYYNDLARKDE